MKYNLYFFFRNLRHTDLAVEDTFCSEDPESGYQCPGEFVCKQVNMPLEVMGFDGFDHICEYASLDSIFVSFVYFSCMLVNDYSVKVSCYFDYCDIFSLTSL